LPSPFTLLFNSKIRFWFIFHIYSDNSIFFLLYYDDSNFNSYSSSILSSSITISHKFSNHLINIHQMVFCHSIWLFTPKIRRSGLKVAVVGIPLCWYCCKIDRDDEKFSLHVTFFQVMLMYVMLEIVLSRTQTIVNCILLKLY
jgi:hypothetical protein